MIEGVGGVHKSIDDVLVEARTKRDMYAKLCKIFSNCRRDGITLHPDKFKLGTHIKFGGFLLDCADHSVGPKILPDTDKVNRLLNYKPRQNKTQVRQFVGLLKQLNNWSSKLTKLSNNFKKLENSNSRFIWNEDHQREFDNLKREIGQLGFLSPFDVSKDMSIVVDASKEGGLGYMLYQESETGERHIIQMASTGLTKSQRNYSATELELLGVVWSLQHAKIYTTGNNLITVFTDHSAIAHLSNKNLADIENPRIIRLLEKILHFNYVVKYLKGAENKIADCLSRY